MLESMETSDELIESDESLPEDWLAIRYQSPEERQEYYREEKRQRQQQQQGKAEWRTSILAGFESRDKEKRKKGGGKHG